MESDWWTSCSHDPSNMRRSFIGNELLHRPRNRPGPPAWQTGFTICKECPPYNRLAAIFWFRIFKHLDRTTLKVVMQLNKSFQKLVEKYLEIYFDLVHPRYAPNLRNLVRTGHYFHNITNLELRSFLEEKGVEVLVLHDAHFHSNLFKITGSFLNRRNEVISDPLIMTPRIVPYWQNFQHVIVKQFVFLTSTKLPEWCSFDTGMSRITKVRLRNMPHTLRDLALFEIANKVTKSKIQHWDIPPWFKEELHRICPEKHLTTNHLMNIFDPMQNLFFVRPFELRPGRFQL